jgi:hypothetical protein
LRRVCIVGAGYISHIHAEAVKSLPGLTLHAVVDVSEAAAKAFAARWGVPKVFTDIDAAIASGEIEAAHVVVPPDVHASFRRRPARLAEPVAAAGFPLAGILSAGVKVTTGTVNALAGMRDDRRLLQISAEVQPGNSGGPLFDANGAVLGVIVSKLDSLAASRTLGDIPQNVNFAVSGQSAVAFLQSQNVKIALADAVLGNTGSLMHALKRDAFEMKEALLRGEVGRMATILNRSWEAKRRTAASVSNAQIDRLMEAAFAAGATAGKVSGDGGGGFITFLADPSKRLGLVRRLQKEDGQVMTCSFTKRGTEGWRIGQ